MGGRRFLRVALAAILGGLLAAILATCGPSFGSFENPDRDRRRVEACILELSGAEGGITQRSLDDCIHDLQWQGRRSCPRHERGYHRRPQSNGGGR